MIAESLSVYHKKLINYKKTQKIIGEQSALRLFFCGDNVHSRIKLSARLALSGAYLKTLPLLTLIIFSVFIFALCNPLVNFYVDTKYFSVSFTVISLVAFILISSPARLRLETNYFMFARGMKNISVKTGFSGFKKSLMFYTAVFCLKSFWFAVFEAIPVSAATMFYFYLNNNSLSLKATIVFCVCIAILALVGIGFYLLFIQRYSKAAFYLACYEDFSAFDAIGESVRKTKDTLADILFFKLGFLPWFMLCIGIVPMLFVIPYYKQSLTIYFLR